MATTLRLRPEAAVAIRAEAARTGRSQQELIREAVDRYLGLRAASSESMLLRSDADALVANGVVLPARSRFRVVEDPIVPPTGVTTIGMLDREDRG
ncbi:MAG: ribbon-helix-helix protein, CopG family [Actinomycetota bacterium]|nr:ribbon-helix-helix protein, CopG family [Actinomycetota bacterium]